MSDGLDSTKPATGCGCKVGTVIKEYELDGANDDLVARWTGQQKETESVRTLANRLNRRLLRAEMRAADMDTVEGRVENLYRLLTDDDALDAVRIQARSALKDNDVDVQQLENAFISHQTVYRHLRNCLEIEKETDTLSIEKERNRVNSMQNRAEAVIIDSVSRLRDGNELIVNDFKVLVNFRVTCEKCGTLYDVPELLDRGGCECQM